MLHLATRRRAHQPLVRGPWLLRLSALLALGAATPRAACLTQGTVAPAAPVAGGAKDVSAARALPAAKTKAAVWCQVEKVVDADTIHVQLEGKLEKLRLMSVDTEEKISGNTNFDPGKPQTVFGEECALWAQALFESMKKDGQPARVGLAFPGGERQLDAYGRVLCHVILEDGSDFNLRLVEEGKSPYFNKYGNSEIDHAGFVAAQARARQQKLGIWNPNTNQPKTAGAPSARRDYEELLPWWDARAQAVDHFRREQAERPEYFIASDVGAQVAKAGARGAEVEVFGTLQQLFDETDGSATWLMRGGDKARSVRLRIKAEHKPALASVDPTRLVDERCQNYFYARGVLVQGSRGFELWLSGPAQIRIAEPSFPAKAR